MADSFFFYDLETSGISPSSARIMQFAGQRTDTDLNPIGEPVNVLIKLAPDVLPEPDAVFITGITPQSTIADGLTEVEFLKLFYDEVVTPNTTFLGFNTVRFDDEFMRFLHYRNFYDPYEWQWANGCSRWDILDLVRMTRALRPDGIEWPVTPEGKPTNRLELLTKVNGLDHEHAHDALNDVLATIAIAKLIREKQPELFKYLFEHRNKKTVDEVVMQGQPFIYTTGNYGSQHLHTSAAVLLAPHPQPGSALVYDLRHDPTLFVDKSVEELADSWHYKKDRDPNDLRLPVKTLKFNRCPAVAPLGVLKGGGAQERLDLTLDKVAKNFELLKKHRRELAEKVLQAVAKMDADRQKAYQQQDEPSVDARLYDGFFAEADKQAMRLVRAAAPEELSSDMVSKMPSKRLQQLLPLYKARNYPSKLTDDERQAWDKHVAEVLLGGGEQSRAARYFGRLQELSTKQLASDQQYLLEELQLYGESIMPTDFTE